MATPIVNPLGGQSEGQPAVDWRTATYITYAVQWVTAATTANAIYGAYQPIGNVGQGQQAYGTYTVGAANYYYEVPPYEIPPPPVPTPEAVDAARLAASRAERARARARELLLLMLSPAQRLQWNANNSFDVALDNSRVYRLPRDGYVSRIIPRGPRYCIHTVGIPREDELLGFKLLLEANEPLFLQIANEV